LNQVDVAWQETLLLDSIREPISHVFEDQLENVWLCGKSHIYKVETVDGELTNIESIPITNPSQDETVGLAYGNEVYVAASGQFSIFDHKSSFVKFDSLPGPRKYFASGGYFWFNDGTRWRTVDSRVQSLKLEWLGMFPNLRYLAPDQAGNNLWVITATNELYSFSRSAAVTATTYPLYLREIRGQEVSLADQIEVEEHEGAITFEFIQPAYLGLNATQYRYQIKGLNSQWSGWSASNNEIGFSYLPPGKYQLLVQSRDLLGNESKIEQIAFKVLPPYWKRWWFYALEFTVFSLLVALSVRIGRANKRYRFVSQILSLLTIVMLVQFLQTAISGLIGIKTSPVIEFIIQVFVALAIFPVEIFARDAMMKYVEGKYRIRRIWDKDK
jgi:Y_Y_Y domain